MITLDETPKKMSGGAYEMGFTGLSTDDKPTGTYDDKRIANGSSYLEVDTHTVYFYDEEGAQWH